MPNSEKTITIDNFVSRIVNPTSRLAETIQISLQPVHELVGRVYKLASVKIPVRKFFTRRDC